MDGASDVKGKGKGKEKGKDPATEPGPCYNFAAGKGCKYGESCQFEHDKVLARKEKRCLVCGRERHFRSDCPMVRTPKTKLVPQPKGVTEEGPVDSHPSLAAAASDSSAQEALFAEAAKLLKGVSLKPLRLGEGSLGAFDDFGVEDIDKGWLRTAVANASGPSYALVDSGATTSGWTLLVA